MLLIYPLLFFIIFAATKEKSQKPIYVFVLLFFLFTSLGAFFLHRSDSYYKYFTISLPAIIFHCLCLFLIVRSYRNYDVFLKAKIIKIPSAVLYFFACFFLVCGFVAIGESLPQVSLASIVGETQYLRTLLDEKGGQSLYLTYFGVKYWTIPLVLGFYYSIYEPKKKILIVLLFIASSCYVIDGLRFAGRECIMKYAIMFVALYFVFKNKMQKGTINKYRVLMIILGSIAIVFFSIITYMRFDASQVSQDSSTGSSLLSYFSQGYINFSPVFETLPNGLTGGRGHFPVFFRGALSNNMGTNLNLNTFSTCVGTWIKDNGIFFSLIVTIVYSFIIRTITKIKINIFTLFYFSWAIEFCLSAPFFFNDVINGSRFVSMLLIIIVDVVIRFSTTSKTE